MIFDHWLGKSETVKLCVNALFLAHCKIKLS